jgi:hypothetical protein
MKVHVYPMNSFYKYTMSPTWTGLLTDFGQYFWKQWLTGRFTRWQVYHTPAGYTVSNSTIESFNKQLKQKWTKNEKQNILAAVNSMRDVVQYYAIDKAPYETSPIPHRDIINLAKSLTKENFFIHDQYNYVYTSLVHTTKHIINSFHLTCTCSTYLDKRIFMHLVGCAIILNFSIPNYTHTKEFVKKTKRGRPAKATKTLTKD